MKLIAPLLVLVTSALLVPSAVAQLIEAEKEDLPSPEQTHHEKHATVTPTICWIDDTVPVKGFLLCVHGLGLHKGTYEAFGQRMAKLGWGVYAVDVRGFGSFQKMPGPAPRTVDFEGCLQDVKAALEFVHKEHPGAPVYMVGESMGGGISLQATARYPELVDGLISSVPGAERFHAAGDSVKVGLHMVAGAKKDFDVTKIVVDRSTDKADLRAAWLQDNLGRFSLSPVELLQFQLFMDKNAKAARTITTTPVLMMSGTQDTLVKHEDQRKLIFEIADVNKDAHQVYIDGAEHLILEEGQFNDGVIALLDNWLSHHVNRVIELNTSAKLKTSSTSNTELAP